MKTLEKPSGVSQNVAWTIHKGSWITHVAIVIIINTLLTQIFGKNIAWQITSLLYNISTFIFFHWIQGDPFDSRFDKYTFWEQLTEQLEATESTVFLGVFPVVLFIIINHFVIWNDFLFLVTLISLILVLIPKLGCMHLKRLFNLRRK